MGLRSGTVTCCSLFFNLLLAPSRYLFSVFVHADARYDGSFGGYIWIGRYICASVEMHLMISVRRSFLFQAFSARPRRHPLLVLVCASAMSMLDEDYDGDMDAEAAFEEDTCFGGQDCPPESATCDDSDFLCQFHEDVIPVSLPLMDGKETPEITHPGQASSSHSAFLPGVAGGAGVKRPAESPESATCEVSEELPAAAGLHLPATPAKRRRIRGKTQVDSQDVPLSSLTLLKAARFQCGAIELQTEEQAVVFPSDAQWRISTHRWHWRWIHRNVRAFWGRQMSRGHQSQHESMAPEEEHSRGRAPKGCAHKSRVTWTKLGPLEKRAAAEAWSVHHSPPTHIAASMDAVFPAEGHTGCKLVGQTALLTWIGPWGLKDSEGGWMSLPPDVTLESLCERLKTDPKVRELWQVMQEKVADLQRRVAAQDAALCLEVCPETFEKQRICRLHLHAYLRHSVRLRLPPSGQMEIDAALPQMSTVVGGMAMSRKSNSWSGYFYCVVEKVGQLWSAGTRRPFNDFLVNGTWIMNLLQASKIEPAYARELVLKCASGARRFLDEIGLAERELERKQVQTAKRIALSVLEPAAKPFKTFAAIEEWKAQYRAVRWRYKFLVLVGPSRMGKTQLARSLVEPAAAEILELNCSSGDDPAMREFIWTRHKLILFDEAHPQMVARQRLLFQAGTQDITLGTSATNCHSYNVYCHQVRMVLCTNCWEEETRGMIPEDREWLAANSVIVKITQPCWVG